MDKGKPKKEIISKEEVDSTQPKPGVSRQSKTSKVVTFEESVDRRCDRPPALHRGTIKRFSKLDTSEKPRVKKTEDQQSTGATKQIQESIVDKGKPKRGIISKKEVDSAQPKPGVSRQSKTSKVVTFEDSKPEKKCEKSRVQFADSPLEYEELSIDTSSAATNVSSEESVDRRCDRPPALDRGTIKRFSKLDTSEKPRVKKTEHQQSTGATKQIQGSASNISEASSSSTSSSSTLSVMEGKSVQMKVKDRYEQYLNYAKKVITYVKVKEINEDLFTMPTNYSLAHCVAEDLAMERGIAAQFNGRFKRIGELYMQRQTKGGLAILEEKERFIYYLITMKKSTCKPTMRTLWFSLKRMQKHIQEHQITNLAMPRIGCGLDLLKWEEVKPMLEFLFQDIDVAITVCNFQQPIPPTSPNKQKKCAMTDVAYPIINISCETIIVYLGSENGFVTDHISTLNNKFNILSDYKLCKLRTQGSVVRTCQIGYILYGFIVRKSSKDIIDFTSLVACAEAVNKNYNKDKYISVAIEAFNDKNDDLLLFKVCNALRCVLLHVNLYICWPNELKYKMPRRTLLGKLP